MSYIKHAKWDEILDLDLNDKTDPYIIEITKEIPHSVTDKMIEESDMTAKIILWCSCSGIEGDNPKCPRHGTQVPAWDGFFRKESK